MITFSMSLSLEVRLKRATLKMVLAKSPPKLHSSLDSVMNKIFYATYILFVYKY